MLVALQGYQGYPLPVFTLSPTLSQNVAYNASGGASTASTAFQNDNTLGITEAVMVTVPTNATSGNVRIKFGAAPVADSTSTLLLPGVYIFAVPKGGKIAVLSNDAGTGSITVTELVSYLPHNNQGTQ